MDITIFFYPAVAGGSRDVNKERTPGGNHFFHLAPVRREIMASAFYPRLFSVQWAGLRPPAREFVNK
ncbi:conserved hypothetical protein [delta proteobacterium NaphS2]|nr:conserved hypothetical protein [delta proteobacterium NaphS2]